MRDPKLFGYFSLGQALVVVQAPEQLLDRLAVPGFQLGNAP